MIFRDYEKGYRDGVNEFKAKLIYELKELLEEEKQAYSDSPFVFNEGDQDRVHLGWVEALEMVLNTLNGK